MNQVRNWKKIKFVEYLHICCVDPTEVHKSETNIRFQIKKQN